jgi:hypothetical protein
MHVPRAHTDGDAIVHFVKGDVIHMGDTFFNGMYPFIDTASGGTIDGSSPRPTARWPWPATARRSFPATARSPPRPTCAPTADMLAAVSQRIKQMLRDGKKLEEITASNVTADFDEKWGKGFIKANKFAEMVAMNLLKNQ